VPAASSLAFFRGEFLAEWDREMCGPTPKIRILRAGVALLGIALARTALAEDGDVAALRAEMAALKAAQEALKAENEVQRATMDASVDTAVEEPPLKFYGFLDTGLQKTIPAPGSRILNVLPATSSTFVLGNINLYADAQLGKSWSALVETRLTNYPNGEDHPGTPAQPYTRTTTQLFDLTNPGGGYAQVRWGGIIIERAYAQWRKSDALQVRAGLFLTPFGIWNVDHGTPTLISLMLPQFEIQQLFPTRQLGLELLGTRPIGPGELGYFAYISNGRTPGQLDLNEDKMLGGRAYYKVPGWTSLTVGASFFRGRYVDVYRNITSFNPFRIESTTVEAYDEQAEGVDLSLDIGALRVRSELVHRWIEYDEGKRPIVWNVPGLFASNHDEWDFYALVAYQLPWGGLEPFVYAEAFSWPTPIGEGLLVASAGFNIHFTPSVQIKTQAAIIGFFRELEQPSTLKRDVLSLTSRLVLAF
jgi:hypothetical protein